MLGSLLRQAISGMEGFRRKYHRPWEQREAIGGRKPQLGEIVKIVQLITSSQHVFMVIDALDEGIAVQGLWLF